ncbi:MAG: energy transducer TonB [Bacteroidales bacterium]|nr:energy transducer TonB [Bacteroidales bacterium]
MSKINHWMITFVFSLVFNGFASAQYFELKPAQNFGGKQQLNDYIAEEMVYPEKAMKDKTEGTVMITCIVTKDGDTKDIRVSNPASPELDAEALRIFSHLLWEPSVYRGMNLDSEAMIEIDFKIKKYLRAVKKRGYEKIKYPYEPVDTTLIVYKTGQLNKPPKPVFEKPGMRFGNFISENMVYPQAALSQEIMGTVALFFVVEPSGRVSNIKVDKSVGGGCNEEAIRLLKLMKWEPGISEDKAVRTEMILHLTFNLADYENLRYIPASNNNQF